MKTFSQNGAQKRSVAESQKWDQFWERCRQIAAYYQEQLGKVEKLEMPPASRTALIICLFVYSPGSA